MVAEVIIGLGNSLVVGLTLDQVRRIFTRWAPWYDATHMWLPGRKAAGRALQLRPGERVLDIACGTGLELRHLRRAIGETGTIVAVDLTPAMLDRARRRVARHGWRNVQVTQADAARLSFPDASFDAGYCAYALHIIPEYREAIREAMRVLRPGARLVVLDIGIADGNPRRLRRLGHGPHICGVDMGHDVLGALRATFSDVATMRLGGGAGYVALARK